MLPYKVALAKNQLSIVDAERPGKIVATANNKFVAGKIVKDWNRDKNGIKTKKEKIALNPEQKQFLEDFLNETGFEIWNAGCTHRMSVSPSNDGVRVCGHDDPLHPIKEYKDINSATDKLSFYIEAKTIKTTITHGNRN